MSHPIGPRVDTIGPFEHRNGILTRQFSKHSLLFSSNDSKSQKVVFGLQRVPNESKHVSPYKVVGIVEFSGRLHSTDFAHRLPFECYVWPHLANGGGFQITVPLGKCKYWPPCPFLTIRLFSRIVTGAVVPPEASHRLTSTFSSPELSVCPARPCLQPSVVFGRKSNPELHALEPMRPLERNAALALLSLHHAS